MVCLTSIMEPIVKLLMHKVTLTGWPGDRKALFLDPVLLLRPRDQLECPKSRTACYARAGNPHKEMWVQLHFRGSCGGSLEVTKKQK